MNEFQLKYGTNPNQKPARIYMADGSDLPVQILNGRPGYINFLDAFNSWQLVRDLKKALGQPAAASFKHVSPAGAAIGLPLDETLRAMYHIAPETELSPLACAYARARGADRMSSFGDWIALSDVCDLSTAKLIQHEVSDGIIAPGYDADALEVLKSKKKGGYAIVQIDADYEPKPLETRTVFGVTFEQGRQDLDISNETMLQNVVTENKVISDEQRRDLIISLIVLKYTQSNSVCYVPDHRRRCGPAEPRALHPPGRPEGRQLAAAPHAEGAGPAVPRRHCQAEPRQRDRCLHRRHAGGCHRRRCLGRDLHRAAGPADSRGKARLAECRDRCEPGQ